MGKPNIYLRQFMQADVFGYYIDELVNRINLRQQYSQGLSEAKKQSIDEENKLIQRGYLLEGLLQALRDQLSLLEANGTIDVNCFNPVSPEGVSFLDALSNLVDQIAEDPKNGFDPKNAFETRKNEFVHCLAKSLSEHTARNCLDSSPFSCKRIISGRVIELNMDEICKTFLGYWKDYNDSSKLKIDVVDLKERNNIKSDHRETSPQIHILPQRLDDISGSKKESEIYTQGAIPTVVVPQDNAPRNFSSLFKRPFREKPQRIIKLVPLTPPIKFK
jgi:hypothetical protein